MYEKVSTDLNFVDREKQVEKFWKDEKIFEKSIDSRRKGTLTTIIIHIPTGTSQPQTTGQKRRLECTISL